MRRQLAVAALLFCAGACSHAHASAPLLVDDFGGPDGLITAEGHPPGPIWQVTSGSLFRDNGQGWTGVPDQSTDSNVFRMVSLARSFGDVDVNVTMRVDKLSHTDQTPEQDYDGAHIWVRYKSEFELYAVSVDRRDGLMIIKKKCAGGDDNGGTYYNLNNFDEAAIPFGQWQDIKVSVVDQPDGSVQITASRDGERMQAVDHGVGCAPLRGSGGVGIRGDNAELRFAHIAVTEAGTE